MPVSTEIDERTDGQATVGQNGLRIWMAGRQLRKEIASAEDSSTAEANND